MGRESEDIDAVYRSYEKYKLMVFKIARKYSVDENAAEDVTQEVFITLMRHIGNMKDEEHLKKWLMVITKHRALNYKRSTKRENSNESIEAIANYSLGAAPDPENYFIESYTTNRKKSLANDILGKLHEKNERWYDAVIMVYYMGKKQKEVAEELGVSPEVLHSVLQRARKWINDKYRERYEEIEKE